MTLLSALAHHVAVLLASTAVSLSAAESIGGDIRFPADAGVADVTKPPYNAVPDGKTDCTTAIQQALTDFAGDGIIYLPNGTYLISDTLRWMKGEKRNILQGQSRDGTIIKLKDNAPGFGDPTQARAMIWTGRKPAQRFRNGLRNFTLDTGKGNPGAIGAQFIANNQGGIHYVTIRSGDGSGPIGLDLAYTPEEGPFLATYLTVKGFDVGIANSCPVDSVTFENLTLESQNRLGIDIDSQVINIRKLKSSNSVPVINNYGVAVTSVIEAELAGSRARHPTWPRSRIPQCCSCAASKRPATRASSITRSAPTRECRGWRSRNTLPTLRICFSPRHRAR